MIKYSAENDWYDDAQHEPIKDFNYYNAILEKEGLALEQDDNINKDGTVYFTFDEAVAKFDKIPVVAIVLCFDINIKN